MWLLPQKLRLVNSNYSINHLELSVLISPFGKLKVLDFRKLVVGCTIVTGIKKPRVTHIKTAKSTQITGVKVENRASSDRTIPTVSYNLIGRVRNLMFESLRLSGLLMPSKAQKVTEAEVKKAWREFPERLKNDELLHCQSEIPGEDEREAWSLFLEQRFAGEDVFIKLILSDNRLIKLNRAYHWKFVEFKHVHLGDKLDTLGYPFVHLTLRK
jgi:hypothetical protein